MAAIKMVGFKKKGSEKVNLTVKVDADMLNALKELEERVQKEAPQFDISRSDIVEDAFRSFISSANAQLDKLAAEKKHVAA